FPEHGGDEGPGAGPDLARRPARELAPLWNGDDSAAGRAVLSVCAGPAAEPCRLAGVGSAVAASDSAQRRIERLWRGGHLPRRSTGDAPTCHPRAARDWHDRALVWVGALLRRCPLGPDGADRAGLAGAVDGQS